VSWRAVHNLHSAFAAPRDKASASVKRVWRCQLFCFVEARCFVLLERLEGILVDFCAVGFCSLNCVINRVSHRPKTRRILRSARRLESSNPRLYPLLKMFDIRYVSPTPESARISYLMRLSGSSQTARLIFPLPIKLTSLKPCACIVRT
jgi:hypothetical protein